MSWSGCSCSLSDGGVSKSNGVAVVAKSGGTGTGDCGDGVTGVGGGAAGVDPVGPD